MVGRAMYLQSRSRLLRSCPSQLTPACRENPLALATRSSPGSGRSNELNNSGHRNHNQAGTLNFRIASRNSLSFGLGAMQTVRYASTNGSHIIPEHQRAAVMLPFFIVQDFFPVTFRPCVTVTARPALIRRVARFIEQRFRQSPVAVIRPMMSDARKASLRRR